MVRWIKTERQIRCQTRLILCEGAVYIEKELRITALLKIFKQKRYVEKQYCAKQRRTIHWADGFARSKGVLYLVRWNKTRTIN